MNLLSIDGGGIKGLYSAVVLDYLEKRYNVTLVDHVDVISGTSIGGVIALALAAGKRSSEMVRFFLEYGPKVFPPSRLKLVARSCVSLIWPLYGNRTLANALKDFFGEKLRLCDISIANDGTERRPCVCIPAVNLKTGRAKVFKTSHHESLFLDANYRVWEVALATTAAPYFFPIAKIRSSSEKETDSMEFFVDGGLWGNNPSMVAVTEALTYSRNIKESDPKDFSNLNLLSIGNISDPLGASNAKWIWRGLLQWNKKLVLLPLNCQAETSENMAKLLFSHNGGKYLRIANYGNNLSTRQRSSIGMDKAGRKSLELLQQLAMDDISRITGDGQSGDNWLKFYFGLEDLRNGGLS